MRSLLCLSAAAILVLTCVRAAAQDDPFGAVEDDGGFAAAIDGVTSSPSDQPTRASSASPLTSQLLESARRGDLQRADAVSSLARTGKWPEVSRILEGFAGREPGPEVMAEMQQRIGPHLFLEIKQRDDVSDQAKAVLDRIAAAASAHTGSIQRLNRAIERLSSDSIDEKLDAMRTLVRGGEASVEALVAAAIAEESIEARDEILKILLRFGSYGTDPLRQLALYGDDTVRARAIESLGRIDRQAFRSDLLAAYHATDATQAEAGAAAAQLQRLGPAMLDRETALSLLYADFQDRIDAARRVPNDLQTRELWVVDPSGAKAEPYTTRAVYGGYRDVADAVTRLRRIGAQRTEMGPELLSADLAYRVVVDPDWGDEQQLKDLQSLYGPAINPTTLSSALRLAFDRRNVAAGVGLVRLIAAQQPGIIDELVKSNGGRPAPLVAATMAGDARLRYEAALAIARGTDEKHFAGSSHVQRCLAEMRSLDRQPIALIVETRPSRIPALSEILSDLGFRVEVVPTVAMAEKRVAEGGDIRMILSKTTLSDAAAVELVDRVRRNPLGYRVPIVLFNSGGLAPASNRWAFPPQVIDEPSTPAALFGMLEDIASRRRIPGLTVLDRESYRSSANELLEPSASDR